MTSDEVTIRPRNPADLPLLASALMDQQAETRYPFRNPLPFPAEEFLHAHDAVSAWTAELAGTPIGHACLTTQARAMPPGDRLDLDCARAHGCDRSELIWVSALFVTSAARGGGVGRRLLEAAVADARNRDRHPCLEVLPVHPAAMAMYVAAGWRTVGSSRPHWLREAAGDGGPDVSVMVLTDPRN